MYYNITTSRVLVIWTISEEVKQFRVAGRKEQKPSTYYLCLGLYIIFTPVAV